MSHIIRPARYSGAAGFDFGNALTFSTDDNVTLGTAVSMAGAFTMSMWIQTDTFNSDRIITNTSGADRFYFPNSTTIQVVWAVLSYTWTFATPMIVDTWMHVVWTRHATSGVMNAWVNGVKNTNTPNTRTNTFSLDTLGQGAAWGGIIDEFGIAPVEASQTNVDDLYNGGAGANFEDVMGAADVYLQLNESGTATIAVDTSANSNNGTLNNFPASGMWNAH